MQPLCAREANRGCCTIKFLRFWSAEVAQCGGGEAEDGALEAAAAGSGDASVHTLVKRLCWRSTCCVTTSVGQPGGPGGLMAL